MVNTHQPQFAVECKSGQDFLTARLRWKYAQHFRRFHARQTVPRHTCYQEEFTKWWGVLRRAEEVAGYPEIAETVGGVVER